MKDEKKKFDEFLKGKFIDESLMLLWTTTREQFYAVTKEDLKVFL